MTSGVGWASGILVFAIVATAVGGPHPMAQTQKASNSTVNAHDISGYWELTLDGRKVPSAELAPRVTKEMIEEHGQADAHAIRWCNLLGTPAIMDSGRPLDIREGTREIVITADTNASPRHLYLDRTQHIAPDVFDSTSNGDSIAHWDSDILVVDTTGFDEKKGLSQVPGGGFRTANSQLVERYRLLENGSVLSVAFTWEDAKVFRTPHTYEFRYMRLPKQYEPMPAATCNPYDEMRTKFLEDAPGKMSGN